MIAVYNNNGRTARYCCSAQQSSYGEPKYQSLQSASVDAKVERVILKALEPASIEISLAAASDRDAEREAVEHQWQIRLERAQQAVDKARRCYKVVAPCLRT